MITINIVNVMIIIYWRQRYRIIIGRIYDWRMIVGWKKTKEIKNE